MQSSNFPTCPACGRTILEVWASVTVTTKTPVGLLTQQFHKDCAPPNDSSDTL